MLQFYKAKVLSKYRLDRVQNGLCGRLIWTFTNPFLITTIYRDIKVNSCEKVHTIHIDYIPAGIIHLFQHTFADNSLFQFLHIQIAIPFKMIKAAIHYKIKCIAHDRTGGGFIDMGRIVREVFFFYNSSLIIVKM